MNKLLILVILIVSTFVSCSYRSDVSGHAGVKLGMPMQGFEQLIDDNGIDDIQKINLTGSTLQGFNMLAGYNTDAHYFPVLVYYLFQNDKLVYFGQAQRFVVHDNEAYREAAKQAYTQVEKK